VRDVGYDASALDKICTLTGTCTSPMIAEGVASKRVLYLGSHGGSFSLTVGTMNYATPLKA
jgi:hypothetical protein